MSRRAWLERLLTDSLVEDGSTGDLSDSDLVGSLIEVAARHRGQPFSLDPVAVEMVLATLTTRFRAGGMAVEFWRSVAGPVAEMLHDDAVAAGRLRALWEELLETAK